MNPLSSIPPTPPRVDPTSSHKERALPSQDSKKDTPAPSSKPPMDVFSLFTPTQEFSQYLERMSQIEDVRQARITTIQKAIDSKSYVISPESLADKLLEELHSQPQETLPPSTS